MALARPGPPGQSAAMRATAILTVKNEGAFLLEWLAHHRACGFTHVLAFSNACSDGTDAMLDRLAQLGGLTHVRNDGPHDQGPHWSALRLAETSMPRPGRRPRRSGTTCPSGPITKRISPHALRHTFAFTTYMFCRNLVAVQKLLGHKSAVLTLDRYGHLYPDDLDAVAAAFDAAAGATADGLRTVTPRNASGPLGKGA